MEKFFIEDYDDAETELSTIRARNKKIVDLFATRIKNQVRIYLARIKRKYRKLNLKYARQHERRNNAAYQIQHHFRIYKSRKLYNNYIHITKIGWEVMAANAVTSISKAWRIYKLKCTVRKIAQYARFYKASVTKISRAMRRHLNRKYFHNRLYHLRNVYRAEREKKASITIQASWRMNVCRKEYNKTLLVDYRNSLTLKKYLCACKIQKFWRKRIMYIKLMNLMSQMSHYKLMIKSSNKIKNMWRMYKFKSLIRKLAMEARRKKRSKQILLIQKTYRGHRVRTLLRQKKEKELYFIELKIKQTRAIIFILDFLRYRIYLKKKNNSHYNKNNFKQRHFKIYCITKVQSFIRMVLTRKWYQSFQRNKWVLQVKRMNEAVLTIQQLFRRVKAKVTVRKAIKNRRRQQTLLKLMQLKTQAAVTIQSQYRVYRSRKRFVECVKLLLIKLHLLKQHRAALFIQRKYHNHRLRAEIKRRISNNKKRNLQKSIIKIQSFIRMGIAKKKAEFLRVMKVEKAAQTIQKFTRGKMARNLCNKRLFSVYLIQNWWRSIFEEKKLAFKKKQKITVKNYLDKSLGKGGVNVHGQGQSSKGALHENPSRKIREYYDDHSNSNANPTFSHSYNNVNNNKYYQTNMNKNLISNQMKSMTYKSSTKMKTNININNINSKPSFDSNSFINSHNVTYSKNIKNKIYPIDKEKEKDKIDHKSNEKIDKGKETGKENYKDSNSIVKQLKNSIVKVNPNNDQNYQNSLSPVTKKNKSMFDSNSMDLNYKLHINTNSNMKQKSNYDYSVNDLHPNKNTLNFNTNANSAQKQIQYSKDSKNSKQSTKLNTALVNNPPQNTKDNKTNTISQIKQNILKLKENMHKDMEGMIEDSHRNREGLKKATSNYQEHDPKQNKENKYINNIGEPKENKELGKNTIVANSDKEHAILASMIKDRMQFNSVTVANNRNTFIRSKLEKNAQDRSNSKQRLSPTKETAPKDRLKYMSKYIKCDLVVDKSRKSNFSSSDYKGLQRYKCQYHTKGGEDPECKLYYKDFTATATANINTNNVEQDLKIKEKDKTSLKTDLKYKY